MAGTSAGMTSQWMPDPQPPKKIGIAGVRPRNDPERDSIQID